MDATGKNMDLRPAVRCAFIVEIFSKTDVYANISWPAHSPSLLACDFFLRGYLKRRVFQPCSADLHNLKLRVSREKMSYHPSYLCNGKCYELSSSVHQS